MTPLKDVPRLPETPVRAALLSRGKTLHALYWTRNIVGVFDSSTLVRNLGEVDENGEVLSPYRT
jgi:hypothetical protein